MVFDCHLCIHSFIRSIQPAHNPNTYPPTKMSTTKNNNNNNNNKRSLSKVTNNNIQKCEEIYRNKKLKQEEETKDRQDQLATYFQTIGHKQLHHPFDYNKNKNLSIEEQMLTCVCKLKKVDPSNDIISIELHREGKIGICNICIRQIKRYLDVMEDINNKTTIKYYKDKTCRGCKKQMRVDDIRNQLCTHCDINHHYYCMDCRLIRDGKKQQLICEDCESSLSVTDLANHLYCIGCNRTLHPYNCKLMTCGVEGCEHKLTICQSCVDYACVLSKSYECPTHSRK
jgi:hypothetical protein